MIKNQNSADNFNVWHQKPWWCQPWSIILTGIAIVGSSWLLLHIRWLSIIVALAIAVWWWYFLLLYPLMAKEFHQQ